MKIVRFLASGHSLQIWTSIAEIAKLFKIPLLKFMCHQYYALFLYATIFMKQENEPENISTFINKLTSLSWGSIVTVSINFCLKEFTTRL